MNPFLLTLLKNYNEKDMTQEEKAKAYDEVLERANKELQACGSTDCDAAKQIFRFFPELKESEDERIRRELITHCRNTRCVTEEGAERIAKWIAWLEKQGESIKIKKGKNYLCTKTHKYAGVEWIEGVKYYSPEDYSLVNQGCTCYCPKYSKEEHNNFFKEVECDGCLEKQGEQEPIKWKDSDEKYLFWALLSIQKDIAASEINGVNTKDLNDCVRWLYSLKQRIGG